MSAQPGNYAPVIRAMRHDDLNAVLELEECVYDFPWSRQIFSDCLMAGYFANVLEAEGSIIGYALLSTAAAEAHILNLCVDPDYRMRGYGRLLLHHLQDYAIALDVRRIFLEVRPSNAAAVRLYEQAGFIHLGVRKAYYRAVDGREDALVLVRELDT